MSNQNQYIVSARKYRPATFNTVVGQRALTTTLKNAIKSDKLAQAYLFCGPRGVGKTSCARIFAKTINCMNPGPDGEACGECESCKGIDRGNSFNLVELDAASNNSVDDIRSITDQVNIPAQDGRYRVFIIDEVHMLTNNAFNAFLKTLEEPPKNVVFILATTERHKVIPTILSRCQVYDFRRITVDDIIDHLEEVAKKEGITVEREALSVIALKADGAMRDALSIFDQVAASTNGNITFQGTIEALNELDQEYYFRLMNIFKSGDVAASLLMFKEITDKGFEGQIFLAGLARHIRNLMVSADARTVGLLETSRELEKKYVEQASMFPVEWYYTAMKLVNDAEFNYRASGNKRLLVELTLIRLSRLLNPVQPSISEKASVPFEEPGGNKPQSVPAVKTEATIEVTPVIRKEEQKESQTVQRGSVTKQNRPKSFRLTETAVNLKKDTSKGNRNSSFTADQVKKLWDDYITAHPEQRILVAAMRASEPVSISATNYKVTVDHPAQKQAFESVLPELLEFFKQNLDNDGFELTVEISETSPDEKEMNSKEFLKLVVDENPVIASFLRDIEAELE